MNEVPIVLLVDQEPDVCERLQQSFQQAGFAFVALQRGDEAFEAAVYYRPDVVILDVVLPAFDGFEVYRQLRQAPELAETPVIFLTGLDDDELALAAYDLGAYDYVTKPVNPDVLVAKVRTLVGRDRRRLVLTPYEVEPGMLVGGRFRVEHELGRGNMGVVFLATHTTLRLAVALKVLVTQGPDPKVTHERFEREARALAGLRHPNLIRIHDAGWWGKLPYMAMDYIDGGTVYDMVQALGRLPMRRALEIAAGVCDGMQAAHDHTILHRDLKTANILLAEDGTPVVSDFGLLMLERDDAERLTEQGFAVGTPHYMSPEQIRTPDAIDARSDVYSIGVCLYEMLTGRTPFHGLSTMDAMSRIMQQAPPPPRIFNPELPPAVERCCQGALTLERHRRYPSAADMGGAIRNLLAELGGA